MNMPMHDPENYCPICGLELSQTLGHRCDSKTLTAIDAARTRDYVQMHRPNLAERLKDGFRLLDNDDEDNDELARTCPACRHAVMIHWF